MVLLLPRATVGIIRPLRSLPRQVRFKSAKPTYHDLETYLNYAAFVKLRKESTAFQGTTYEMKVKQKLETALNMSQLEHSGGSYDNGIDLLGKLDIDQFKSTEEPNASYLVHGKRVKPLILRKSTAMDVLVQCKSFSSKITAKEIRELSGIFNFNIRPKDRNNSLVIMSAPSLLTSQGQAQIDKVDIPMVYCQLSRMKQTEENEYSMDSYIGGEILNFYFNPYSIALFQGTNFPLHARSMIEIN